MTLFHELFYEPYQGHKLTARQFRVAAEVIVSFITGFLGVWILMPFPVLSEIPHEHLQFAPEWAWGLAMLVVSAFHAFALWVNGRRWWTPLLRLTALALHAIIVAYFLASFMDAGLRTSTPGFFVPIVILIGLAAAQTTFDVREALYDHRLH